MEFVVKEADIMKMVIGYLVAQGSFETASSLALEANSSLGSLGTDLLYLQQVVLQGRWDAVAVFLSALKDTVSSEIARNMEFIVQRQKYLEMLSWQGGGVQRMAFPPWKPCKTNSSLDNERVEMDLILEHLNKLKGLCTAAEFNALCAFLTLDRLDSHADYKGWTVAQGRWKCNSQLRQLLWNILPGENEQEPIIKDGKNNGLLRTVAMSLAYQTAISTDKAFAVSSDPQQTQLDNELGFISPLGIGRNNFSVDAPTVTLQSPIAFNKQFAFQAPNVKQHSFESDSKQQHGNHSSGGRVSTPNVSTTTPTATRSRDNQSISVRSEIAISPPIPPLVQQHTMLAHFNEISAAPPPPLIAATTASSQQQRLSIEVEGTDRPQGESSSVIGNVKTVSTVPLQPTTAGPGLGSFTPQNQISQIPQVNAFQQTVFNAPIPQALTQQQQYQLFLFQQAQLQQQQQQQQLLFLQQQQQLQLQSNLLSPQQSSLQNPLPVAQITQASQPISSDLDPKPSTVPMQSPVQPTVTVSEAEHRTPPSSQSKPAPVAWVVGDDESMVSIGKATRASPHEHVAIDQTEVTNSGSVVNPPAVSVVAFTAGTEDVRGVKPMPAALRKKMLADQQAAAAAEEERRLIQGDAADMAKERSGSRGRARSAPRGAAGATPSQVPVSIAIPGARVGSEARPQQLTNRLPVSSPGPQVKTAGADGRPTSAGRVNMNNTNNGAPKSNPKPVAVPLPLEAERERFKAKNLATATPGNPKPFAGPLSASSSSPISGINENQHSALQYNYSNQIVFESKVPLRCVNVLFSDSSGTHVAVGTNAKSVHTMCLSNSRTRPVGVTMEHEFIDIHKGSVYTTDWHEGLGLIASGSNDKAVRLSNPRTGAMSEPMKDHNGTIRVVKFLPSSLCGSGSTAAASLLASAGAGDCRPRLWDAQTGSLIRTLTEHPEAVHGLVWVNNNILVTGCDHGQIIGHDLRAARSVWSYNLNDALQLPSGDRKGVCCLALLSNPNVSGGVRGSDISVPMLAGCVGGFVTMFDAVDGRIFYHNKLHEDDVRSVAIMPGPGVRTTSRDQFNFDLLTASYDGTAAVWSVQADNQEQSYSFLGAPHILEGHIDKVLNAVPVVNPNKTVCDIISTGADGKAILWSVDS